MNRQLQLIVNHVRGRSLYLVCPDVLRTVEETSYGIRVGFTELDIVFNIFLIIYLLIGINLCFR